MYEEYWGLAEKPFENTSDPRFIYHSSQHDEALTLLLYAVTQRKSAALLTGEYGCGKTLTSRLLVDMLYNLDRARFEIAVIVNPRLSPDELLQQILYKFGIKNIPLDRIELLNALGNLLMKNAEAGKHTVIIVDEAQIIIDEDTIDELRVLLNFQLNDRFLLTLVLIGQSEFANVVDALPQLQQRIAVRFHLEPLSSYEETRAYIQHRLSVAKPEREIFTEEAIQKIHKLSQGIPRQINNICDIALLMGFMHKLSYIDADNVDQRHINPALRASI
ncbi:AAA family ATPase [Candidatus Poribacteria bacterium]|nr:AAA family ATPase [Candidatus Poribacteria bacterium]